MQNSIVESDLVSPAPLHNSPTPTSSPRQMNYGYVIHSNVVGITYKNYLLPKNIAPSYTFDRLAIQLHVIEQKGTQEVLCKG